MSDTILDRIIAALESAATYNKNDLVAPLAILWPDKQRQWAAVIPVLRTRWPIFTLGHYQPENLTGPAIWIRPMVAKMLPEATWEADQVPVVYLPGYSRSDLRAIESCPRELLPIAELQYRGVIWSQKNGRDWTLLAFLSSKHGGLEIEVAADNATLEALQQTSQKLLTEKVETLRDNAPLKAEFFHSLLVPDLNRQVLVWLNNPDEQKNLLAPEKWQSFCAACRQRLQFDPETDGPLSAAEKLGVGTGAWSMVWQRFKDAPLNYPHIPALLRQAKPQLTKLPQRTQLTFFDDTVVEAWPQDNEHREGVLRQALLDLAHKPPDQIQTELERLEQQHGYRRQWVWAKLGQAPLATALEHLCTLASELSGAMPKQGSVQNIAGSYFDSGWKVDYAALKALATVTSSQDLPAVAAVLDVLYAPWLSNVCEAFQQAWLAAPPKQQKASRTPEPGVAYLFVDGLRLDMGHILARRLGQQGLSCQLDFSLAALPTVTETAKPAVTPVAGEFFSGPELTPTTRQGTVVTADVIRKTLTEAGFTILSENDVGDPATCAWTECGRLDEIGHVEGWQLAHRFSEQLELILERVCHLLNSGWREVRIVTDHGWLLLPSTLPTHTLPKPATEIRKGRTARLKPAAVVNCGSVPWFWDQRVVFAVAPGSRCFVAGKQYEHGGISPQEVVVPYLQVTLDQAADPIQFVGTKWTGLRLHLELQGPTAHLTAELRTKPADPASALTPGKTIATDGTVSLLCGDHSLEGNAAVAVIFDPAQPKRVLAKWATIIGGGEPAADS